MAMTGRWRLPQRPRSFGADRGVAAHRGRPGPDPVRSRHGGGPASSADRGTGRRRAGRSRTDRADRARMPGRPALGRLGSIAHRRRVGPRKQPRPASAAPIRSPTRPPLPSGCCSPSPSWRQRAGWTAETRHRKSRRAGHGSHAVTRRAAAPSQARGPQDAICLPRLSRSGRRTVPTPSPCSRPALGAVVGPLNEHRLRIKRVSRWPADTARSRSHTAAGSSPSADHDRPLSRPATGRHIADFVLHHLMSALATQAK